MYSSTALIYENTMIISADLKSKLVDIDALYESKVGFEPQSNKSALIIFESFQEQVESVDANKIESDFKLHKADANHLYSTIALKAKTESFYTQSAVLFTYWMLYTKKRRVKNHWPLDHRLLEKLANDAGVSLD